MGKDYETTMKQDFKNISFASADDSYIDAALEVIKVIYDAHPEAIKDNRAASGIQRYH